jgi:signal transduction histidine kinase
VARHSGASEADLTLATEHGMLRLTVTDAGNGLPDGHVPGTGMRGMRERATLIGATLTIDSDRTDGGCRVRLEVPTENGR